MNNNRKTTKNSLVRSKSLTKTNKKLIPKKDRERDEKSSKKKKGNEGLKKVSKDSRSKDKLSKKKPVMPLSEVKISKNVDTISRLINNSNEIISQQNDLLEKCGDITKKITSSDFEIERLMNKNENDDFSLFLDKYGNKFHNILDRLKSHTEEVEHIKCIINLTLKDVKEENKNLNYRLELMSIDKSDSGLHYESKYNSLKTFVGNELNNLNEFLVDLGLDYVSHKFK
jgi:hypothetical protein